MFLSFQLWVLRGRAMTPWAMEENFLTAQTSLVLPWSSFRISELGFPLFLLFRYTLLKLWRELLFMCFLVWIVHGYYSCIVLWIARMHSLLFVICRASKHPERVTFTNYLGKSTTSSSWFPTWECNFSKCLMLEWSAHFDLSCLTYLWHISVSLMFLLHCGCSMAFHCWLSASYVTAVDVINWSFAHQPNFSSLDPNSCQFYVPVSNIPGWSASHYMYHTKQKNIQWFFLILNLVSSWLLHDVITLVHDGLFWGFPICKVCHGFIQHDPLCSPYGLPYCFMLHVHVAASVETQLM